MKQSPARGFASVAVAAPAVALASGLLTTTPAEARDVDQKFIANMARDCDPVTQIPVHRLENETTTMQLGRCTAALYNYSIEAKRAVEGAARFRLILDPSYVEKCGSNYAPLIFGEIENNRWSISGYVEPVWECLGAMANQNYYQWNGEAIIDGDIIDTARSVLSCVAVGLNVTPSQAMAYDRRACQEAQNEGKASFAPFLRGRAI